jgi:DNA segregation ATPase FtsK/SpoIIIE, S-DNA-T family
LPKALAVEIRRLPWRVLGLALIFLALAGWLALLSWSFADPSPSNATVSPPRNWLGYQGASFAAFMMEGFGLASPLLLLPLAAFGFQIATGHASVNPRLRFLSWALALLSLPGFFASLEVPAGWPLKAGLGGIFGEFAAARIAKLSAVVPPELLWPLSALTFLALGAWCVWSACGLSVSDLLLAFEGFQDKEEDEAGSSSQELEEPAVTERLAMKVTSWVKRFSPRDKALVPSGPREIWLTGARPEPTLSSSPSTKPLGNAAAAAPADAAVPADANAAGITLPKARMTSTLTAAEDLASFQSSRTQESQEKHEGQETRERQEADDGSAPIDDRIEPFFGPAPGSRFSGGEDGEGGQRGPQDGSPFLRLGAMAAQAAARAQWLFGAGAHGIAASGIPSHAKKRPHPLNEIGAPAAFAMEEEDECPGPASMLPPLSLLAAASAAPICRDASDPQLMERAAGLMSVLGDFGVKGRISGIYPGPVITLFELEPSRGTKSSRVVGLADDIARSMSAVSARIAVVPGRDAIGIELPNPKREIVSLREILESAAFQNTQAALPIALGKSIGGEPIVVDLARMPHLLIAGTTGSGKSVGINTMILSLLYRLTPSQCNFILIDPKMLELSAYDGIPHLIAPVVTDPKKAVAALKWAVKEMNSRYERMSRLGVRNVGSYNARAAAAQLRGQPLKRTIQTGFDPVTGEPIEEEEIMDAVSMPYLVIVIDEMADLMMCAGKDVEFAVQRLSQMARAAGIHLIMATQRPSVDVVTGTIKANFPSRISFQVTSKIDSRTIIGEQGAEQLLGAGDMLYMASGGRIIRAHGPFVSDGEVEAVAWHLKAQGFPNYRDDILEDAGAIEESAPAKAGSGRANDLYGQAVEIVLKDRKPTASYLQRRLNIGYNRAASLIERMEEEGIVGAPGRTGRREILAEAGR